jgi:hypothetical protein
MPDDVRQLIIAEDELKRSRPAELFRRIFPSPGMSEYLKYVEPRNRYYYMLLNAWESKGFNKTEGIKRLVKLANAKYHL